MAALAHVGVLANGFGLVGVVGAALIWATQREKSLYVSGHALQALGFQVLALLLLIVLVLIWGSCMLLTLLPVFLRPDLYMAELPTPFWIVMGAGVFLLMGVAVVLVGYGLMGAFAALRGELFTYVVVHALVELSRPVAPSSDSQPLPVVQAPAEQPSVASAGPPQPADSDGVVSSPETQSPPDEVAKE